MSCAQRFDFSWLRIILSKDETTYIGNIQQIYNTTHLIVNDTKELFLVGAI